MLCVDCGAPGTVPPNPRCASCTRLYLYANVAKLPEACKIAKRLGLREVMWDCEHHPFSPHNVYTRRCRQCVPVVADKSKRAIARSQGCPAYLDDCHIHGATEFHVNTGKCLTCYNASGVQRSRAWAVDDGRRSARVSGQASYLALCSTHGETAHSTGRGQCLTCFTANGSPRKYLRIPLTQRSS